MSNLQPQGHPRHKGIKQMFYMLSSECYVLICSSNEIPFLFGPFILPTPIFTLSQLYELTCTYVAYQASLQNLVSQQSPRQYVIDRTQRAQSSTSSEVSESSYLYTFESLGQMTSKLFLSSSTNNGDLILECLI